MGTFAACGFDLLLHFAGAVINNSTIDNDLVSVLETAVDSWDDETGKPVYRCRSCPIPPGSFARERVGCPREGYGGRSADMPGGYCFGFWADQLVFSEVLSLQDFAARLFLTPKDAKIMFDVIEGLQAASNRRQWRVIRADRERAKNGV